MSGSFLSKTDPLIPIQWKKRWENNKAQLKKNRGVITPSSIFEKQALNSNLFLRFQINLRRSEENNVGFQVLYFHNSPQNSLKAP